MDGLIFGGLKSGILRYDMFATELARSNELR